MTPFVLTHLFSARFSYSTVGTAVAFCVHACAFAFVLPAVFHLHNIGFYLPTRGGATYNGASSKVRLFVTSLVEQPPKVQAVMRNA